MKAFLIYTFTIASLILPSSVVVKDVSEAMRKGKIILLEKHLADDVDVTVLNDQAYLDKAKAADLVEDFLANVDIKDYSISHKGTSKGAQSLYTIGTLKTNSGNYEVYMYLTVDNGQHQVAEIKIEQ